MQWLNLSIRLKILLLLIGLCLISLVIYASIALKSFQNDKIAYIYESTLAHARSASNQIDAELRVVVDQVNALMGNLQSRAIENQKLIKGLKVLTYDQAQKKYLVKKNMGGSFSKLLSLEQENKMIVEALQNSFSFYASNEETPAYFLAMRFNQGKNLPTVAIAYLDKLNFLDSFYGSGLQNTYLVNNQDQLIIRPIEAKYKISDKKIATLLGRLRGVPSAPFSTFQVEGLLCSYAQVNLASLRVVSLIPQEEALDPIRRLILKSVGVLISVIGMAIFFSLLMSNRLTSDIKKLYEATKILSQGDFKTRVHIRSKDEIGVLAEGFNQMAGQIEVLLGEAAVKARMETELKTAQMVQAKLFPEPTFDHEKIKLHGFFQPASECGGDWWYHFRLGSKIFILVGDATGHGVGPALVTSSAKSVASVLEDRQNVTLPEIMDLLNNVIHKTGKGEIVMTFAVFCIDEKTGEVNYCSASHEPSLLFRVEAGTYSKDSVEYLMESSGPRVGQELKADYVYAKAQLKNKDRLVIFTDGVYDLQKEGQKFGERRWLKTLEQNFTENPNDLHAAALAVDKVLSDYQDDVELLDDVTYVVVQYG